YYTSVINHFVNRLRRGEPPVIDGAGEQSMDFIHVRDIARAVVLATEAEKRRPGLRVLFTSGYTENAIDQDGKLEQGILFLGKPYSRAQLARMLRVALR
ncbi:NAD-dependent epimerase/dehydratase family protein, partial [Klebsiella pneumoniae]